MSGLYVALDVEYDSDDKMILAGPMAELLYVRGLAFCKRTMSNGNISRAQLAVVGRGIPSASRHAATLVEVGAWVITSQGWHVAAWLKRNKSAEEIRGDREAKKAASSLANHRRWHTGPDGKASQTCPHCAPSPDPTSDPTSDPKPKPEPKGSHSHSHSHSHSQRDTNPPPSSISRGACDDAAEEEAEVVSITTALRGGVA
jgi:hypothetical protein